MGWRPFGSRGLVAVRTLAALYVGRGAAAGEAASPAAAGAVVPGRPQVARALIDELFLGVDPLGAIPEDARGAPDPLMTHVRAEDIDMVLSHAAQPVTFWLELGTWEGGSAILTARRVQAAAAKAGRAPRTSIVAVDTFLGDLHCLWNEPPSFRREMLRPDGTVVLYERFRRNARDAGPGLLPLLLPLPATTLSGLRLVADLARRGVAPRPQVIYLDSAHEKGEVWLELQLAWAALAPGGILFGDDWPWEAVKSDVVLFAGMHEEELDDGFGERVHSLRSMGRYRPGLFVSIATRQWFLRKLGRRWLPNRTDDGGDALAEYPHMKRIGYNCWADGFNSSDCCDEARHGPGGNTLCWDSFFSFTMCC